MTRSMTRSFQHIGPVKFINVSSQKQTIHGSHQMKNPMAKPLNKVLLVGSAPDATRTADWDTSSFSHIVVINNAWMACPSWNCLIYPEDFPLDRHPGAEALQGKQVVTAQEFVPVQNAFGGFVYAGGTMAFTAGYWALGALKPDVIAYIGCDMVYEPKAGQHTHFYGTGAADPLRQDVTLQSLEAKSLRFQALAHREGCSVVNLSRQAQSRLSIPRVEWQVLESMTQTPPFNPVDEGAVQTALQAEAALGYWVESGRYWEESEKFDRAKLRAIDALWLATACEVA
jgi:hypothetical protein